ncbi:MAG TPA: glucoamylase family protein, partial [Gemmataceae bacterium]|nr:glucoamylase family protein [Gemmataceae bacterium]
MTRVALDAPPDLLPLPPDAPLRAELLGDDHLADLARRRAGEWVVKVRPGPHPLLRRLRDNETVLRKAHESAAAAAARSEPLMPDAEWLLDNFYVVEDVLREVRTDLPAGFYDELPVIVEGGPVGQPRVYELAVLLVAHTDSHLAESQVLRYVNAFQEVAPLTIGELWAVPIMLRLALLENLRRLGDQMLTARSARDRATEWVQRAGRYQFPDRPSDAFLVALHQAVRDLGDTPLAAYGDWIGRHETDLADILRREHRRQAANQVSVGNSVTSLRLLNAVDWAELFEKASRVETVLRAEPTGVYVRQEFATRDRYRRAVEQFAKATKRDELDVAHRAVARAAAGLDDRTRHVGYYLIGDGRREFSHELGCCFKLRDRWLSFLTDHPKGVFFGSLVTLTVVLTALAALLAARAGAPLWAVGLAAVAALWPAAEVAVALVNSLVVRLLPPRVPPKLDFQTGVPAEWRTVIAIQGMLTRPDGVAALCERLELHYLANPDPQFRFALLTDWADATTEATPTDQPLVEAAVAHIRRLNEKHARGGADRFFLCHRKRVFNPAEGVWMGWERKRGKVDEFNRLLRGATDTTFLVQTGDVAAIGAVFVLTLDADTVLPRDSARRMVATLAHPLNRPVLSADGRTVVAGYGVLQPRVSFMYRTGLRSRFARIFAGSAGIDPYSSATSDVYQDLFGHGTFTGKGLYDVDAFHATAGRAFPENSILSHDLIESTFARCGLVTDVEVFDDFPAKYHAYAKREHRWVRGDWQLLPWLGRTAPTPAGRKLNVIGVLGRWKVFDNLRRSLAPAALIVFLAVGWAVLPGPAWAYSLAAALVVAVPLILAVYDTAKGLMLAPSARAVVRGARHSMPATTGQVLLSAVFLANHATLALDAIVRTLWRLFVSRKHLLEWETAAAAEARLGTGLGQFVRTMWQAVAVAGFLAALVGWANPPALWSALPWLAAWALSPLVAWWVSRPLAEAEPPLTDRDRAELRRTARKTWRFFETFVTEEDHWLPPDNFQEDPKGVVAHRTSPTNKGLLLLSTMSAHDLGYVTLPDLATRLGQTFDTLDKLDRYRGHFLNWYETTTLRVLPPGYVSTVDSGNQLGCLLALKYGLRAKADEPIPSPAAIDGLVDALDLAAEESPSDATAPLRAHLAAPPRDLPGWADWLVRAEKLASEIPRPAGRSWAGAVADQVLALRDEIAAVCPWLGELAALRRSPDGLAEVFDELATPAGVRRWAERLPVLRAEIGAKAEQAPALAALAAALDRSQAAALVHSLEALAQRAVGFADAMDFRFLYNDARHLFSIGYNVPLERLDAGHYDLIASEAALTCFLMVARGVVPRKHWFQLGRLTTDAAGRPGLISWGGTMFEYLMPRLLLRPAPGTMLDVAQHAAVARHREYGRQTRLPWGVSESGFYVLSAEGDYQYQSFGVPGLGLKRGLGKDLVVAPYATLLAVMEDAPAAVANFGPLRAAGGEGPFGFYEAIDFTPDRLARGEKCKVIQSYMAHHQGMGLCAIANRLLGDVHCRRLHAEPAVRAVDLLLQERVPLDAPPVRPDDEDAEAATPAHVGEAVSRRITSP